MDLSDTIQVDSSQINSADLFEPRIFRLVGIQRGPDQRRPIEYRLEGEDKVFRPCKTVRRILVKAWGKDGNDHIGHLVRLYCDPTVRNPKGTVVGGTRVNGLSHTTKTTITVSAGQSGMKEHKIEILHDAPHPALTHIERAEAALDDHADKLQDIRDELGMAQLGSDISRETGTVLDTYLKRLVKLHKTVNQSEE